jgi:hypothetical protein
MIHSSSFRLVGLLCCFALTLSLAGCGSVPRGKVKGKVVLPQGVKLEKDDSLQVIFVTEGPSPESAAGKVDPSDLTFHVEGGEGKGVPAGKVKVSVTCTPYAGNPGSQERKIKLDKLFDPFVASKTPLSVELTTGEQTITVDLDKKTVTK